MGKQIALDVRVIIMDKMDNEGRALSWLADKTGINYNTLYSILKRRIFPLSEDNLNKINKALETDFVLQSE
jgi:lambda repressor-like predicted transcriptional regulator